MSQVPPPGSHQMPYSSMPAAPRQTNGWAIASLVCGLLGCAFGVTGLLGFIFGIVGIKKARQVGSGMGMAVAGMIVGLIFVLGWSGCGIAGYWVYQKSLVVARTMDTEFLNSLSEGDLAKARSHTSPSFSDADLALLAAQVKPLGKVKSVTVLQFNQVPGSVKGNDMQFDVRGVVEFDSSEKNFTQVLTGTFGSYRIDEFKLR